MEKTKKKAILLFILMVGIAVSCSDEETNEPEQPQKQKVIIDTDMVNTFDDGVAYLLLAARSEVEILGVTTVTGNTWAAEGLAYAIRQGEIAKATATKFIQGSDVPFREDRLSTLIDEINGNPGGDWIGSIGYDKITDWHQHYVDTYGEEPSLTATDVRAEDFIIEQVMQNPGEITLLAIGPCTNIAKALAKEPKVAMLARQIVYMGGAVYCPGNTTPYAEMNFFYDPEAAAKCLDAPFRKQILVSLDVCNTVWIDYDTYFSIYNNIGSEALKDCFRRMYFYDEFSASRTFTSLVWDVISAALVLDESLMTEYRIDKVAVDDNPHSPTYGKSYLTTDTDAQNILIPLSIDNQRFFNLLKTSMSMY